MDEVGRKGKLMYEAIAPLEQAGKSVSVRGRGMVYGLDVGDGVVARKIIDACFEDGLIVSACGSGGRVIKLIPPLTIPQSQLETGLAILVKQAEKVLGGAA